MQEENSKFQTEDERSYFNGWRLASFIAGQFLSILLITRLSGNASTFSLGRLLIVFFLVLVLGLLFGFLIHILTSIGTFLLDKNQKSSWLRLIGIVLLVSAAVYFFPILFPAQSDEDEPYHSVFQVANASEECKGRFFVSVESDRYHRVSCQYVKNINFGNLVYFDSAEDAEDYGFSPCPVCQPDK